MTASRLATGLLVVLVVAGCANGDKSSDRLWTVRQAESITSIRGTPVRVRHCRRRGGQANRDTSFECLAGARTASDRYDTVGVFYVLHPLGEYKGRRSNYRFSNVRFVGGPGVP